MAHKKAGGSTRNGRDSKAKRLGVKLYAGQKVRSGNIIVRQRGSKFFPGENVIMSTDFTIFSITEGIVKFSQKRHQKYDGRVFRKTIVNVVKA